MVIVIVIVFMTEDVWFFYFVIYCESCFYRLFIITTAATHIIVIRLTFEHILLTISYCPIFIPLIFTPPNVSIVLIPTQTQSTTDTI